MHMQMRGGAAIDGPPTPVTPSSVSISIKISTIVSMPSPTDTGCQFAVARWRGTR